MTKKVKRKKEVTVKKRETKIMERRKDKEVE